MSTFTVAREYPIIVQGNYVEAISSSSTALPFSVSDGRAKVNYLRFKRLGRIVSEKVFPSSAFGPA